MNRQLRDEREKRGWTTLDVVQRLKVEVHKYISWERDWSEPTEEEIRQLCQFFACDPLTIGYVGEGNAS